MSDESVHFFISAANLVEFHKNLCHFSFDNTMCLLLTYFVPFNHSVEVVLDFSYVTATLDPLHIVIDVLLLLLHFFVQLTLVLSNVIRLQVERL